MHRRRHEYTPIARVVLAFIITAGDLRLRTDTTATAITAVFFLVPSTPAVVQVILPTTAPMVIVECRHIGENRGW